MLPAIPKHKTATSDKPWDGPANKANLKSGEDQSYYEKAYAWRDPDKDETTKGAYSEIHHEVDADGNPGAANIKGCDGVIGNLNGARGGSNIPDADRQGVWDHVAKHLRDANEEPAPLDLLNRIPNGVGQKFWQFKNVAPSQAELILYGEIKSEHSWWDEWFGGSGIYADEFVQDLKDLGNVSQITCRINSIGGDIFAAIAIYTQLKTHPARVVCIIDGLAASAATLIVMSADEIQMPIGAMQMIHDPLACLCGIYNADELGKNVDTLNTIKESIVAIYADRTGQKEADIAKMMSQEKWLTTAEAVELGFCDTQIAARTKIEMKGKVLFMNDVGHDISQFKNIPPGLEAAGNILDKIAAHNAGSDFVTEFVAMAKKDDKPDPDETDNPDQDPETPEDGDKGKAKKGKKNCPKDEDETIDDDDADGDGDDDGENKKGKKAKNTVQRLISRYPKLTAMIASQAKADERARLQAIDSLAGKVDLKLMNRAKYEDVSMTAEVLALAQLKSSSAKAAQFLTDFQKDTEASGVKNAGSVPNAFADQSDEERRNNLGDFIAKVANQIIHKGRV